MKNLILAALAALPCVLPAYYDALTLNPGGSETVSAPGRIVRVRALSTVAAGTVELKSVTRAATVSDAAVVAHATNFTYTVVATNYVSGALETTTNTVAFDPYPFGHANWIAFTTNRVVTATTNFVPTASATRVATNALVSLVCAGGVGTNSPPDAWVLPGDRLFFTGTAAGPVSIVIER